MLGEEIIIAKDKEPLLRLAPILPDISKRPVSGTGRHDILYIADEFDEISEGFEDYI